MTSAKLLVICGVEKIPGPGVQAEKIMQVLCSGCNRNLKSGTQCDRSGQWFHNNCGNVKVQVAESRKWICDKCRLERLRLLQEKLQKALLQIDGLTRKNKALEEQLRLAAAGRQDTVPGHLKGGECLVLGNSIMQNVGTECSNMRVECFLGIRMEQLHRVTETTDLGKPRHSHYPCRYKQLKRTGNLNYVMGDVHDLANTAKTKFSTSKVVLSGVFWRRNV
jgi:hypothetical protein